MDIDNAFKILGLNSSSAIEEVESAYKELALEKHPDKGGDPAEMAELSEARDVLREYLSSKSLPAVIKQFDLAVQNMNELARNQRNVEKKIERITKDIRETATVQLRKWRQFAIILAGISAAAIFIGKDLPKELLVSFKREAIAFPLPAVAKPTKPEFGALLKETKEMEEKELESLVIQNENIKATNQRLDKNYRLIVNRYSQYRSEFQMVEEQNKWIKERNRLNMVVWYAVTFGIGICAGFIAWYFNRRIEHVEIEISDLDEDLTSKSTFYRLLNEILKESIEEKWTFVDFEECIYSWKPSRESWSTIFHAIGAKKFGHLLISKGQEIGLIETIAGSSESAFEEKYFIDHAEKT